MNPKQFREAIEKQCTVIPRSNMAFEDAQEYWRKRDAQTEAINKLQQGAKPYALQVCNAGAMPEDFDSWLKSNGDAIDIGGNWTPDKLQANHDQYDNERHPFS